MKTIFSNLEFWESGGRAAKDIDIVYGKTCSHLQSGKCDNSCAECAFSYPDDEVLMWDSPWAKCRCKDDTTYKYGNPCDEDRDQSKCGSACEFCNISWLPTDEDRWNSDRAECRCVPRQSSDISFGNHECNNNYDGICGNSCSDCRWSWPTSDDDKWNSVDAMCRCAD